MDLDKINCFMNYPTRYSTEDIYNDKSYLSQDFVPQCPGGKEPTSNGSKYKVLYEENYFKFYFGPWKVPQPENA